MAERRSYTPEDKMRAAEAFIRRGGVMQAARETGIPRETIKSWVGKDETFEEWRQRSLETYQGELVAAHAELCWKTADKVRERIEQGDPIIHQGEVTGYAPVKLKEITTAHAILFDKMRIGLALPTSYSAQSNVQEQLKKLQSALEGAIQGRTDDRPSPPKQIEPEQPSAPVH